jgi:hypothetical protein
MEGDWMDIRSQQYDFFPPNRWRAGPSRFFYISSNLYGVPFDGLHAYKENSATMEIKVASVIQVADARGEKMTRGETVTLFNDMCLLAPATLISSTIRWELLDSLHVKAMFTVGPNTISAILTFNEKGEMTDFLSNDRYLSSDGKTYTNYPWSTPVREYRDFDGIRLSSYAEAIWHTPGGEYTYAKFEVAEIEYNCKAWK